MRASLHDFRDLDLMLKIADEGDDEGWVELRQLASSMGADEAEKLNGLGVRFSWMKRFGFLEFDDKAKMWRLSPSGDRIARAKLRAAASKQIEAIPDESIVEVMAHVTSRYRHSDPTTANLLRREFKFGTEPGSRAYRNGSR